MIIKSYVQSGFRSVADYLKDKGENEKTRIVEISDSYAKSLEEAFYSMWTVASYSSARKPLHHISINPYKDEPLTDIEVLAIIKRCEKKYGYKAGEHQRVVIEHIKNGRQHFHVVWNRVSMASGKCKWPGHHWNKSKQTSREMEMELGLKRPVPRRYKRIMAAIAYSGRQSKYLGRYKILSSDTAADTKSGPLLPPRNLPSKKPPAPRDGCVPIPKLSIQQFAPLLKKSGKRHEIFSLDRISSKNPEWERIKHIAWAWENGRTDILAEYGIYVDLDP